MICNNCGGEFNDDANFCPYCGSKAEQRTVYCTNCGKPLDPTKEFCMNCGVRIRNKRHVSAKVGFVEAYKLYWKNAFNFSGRASVAEYWFAILWNIIISVAISILFVVVLIGLIFGLAGTNFLYMPLGLSVLVLLIVAFVWGIVNLIPGISLMVRRLHDSGKSGLFALLSLVWVVGTIILLVFMCLPSDENENQYG